MNVAKKYNVTLFPLTDIHIGSGKDIEAYEYTIKNGYMYRIDISEIMDNMGDFEQENFYKILKKNNILAIRSWIYNNFKEEWGYTYKEKVSSEFEDYYKEKIDGAVDKNANSQLSIFEFIGYNNKKYIPGSSIKGALRTAFVVSYFLENEIKYEIKSKYKIKNDKKVYEQKEVSKEAQIMEAEVLMAEKEDKFGNITNKKEEKLGLEPKKDPFKTVKVSDTEEIDLEQFEVTELKIKEGNLTCEVLKGKYGELKNNSLLFNEGINFNIVLSEYILKNNSKMKYNKNMGIKELLASLDDKIENILDFEIEKERKKDSCNIKEFYEQLKDDFRKIKGENSKVSLIRIGKYTGFNDKTINLVTTEPSENSRTVFDRNNHPMGWALIKVEEVKY